MRDIDGDHKSIEPVQESKHENIAFHESPERIDDDLIALAPFALVKQELGRKFAVPVVFFDMLVKARIGMVKEIAFQMINAQGRFHVEPFMNDMIVPAALMPVDDAQFLIRIP